MWGLRWVSFWGFGTLLVDMAEGWEDAVGWLVEMQVEGNSERRASR